MIIEQKTTNCGCTVSWPWFQAILGPMFQSSSTPNAALNVNSQKGRQQTYKSGLGVRTLYFFEKLRRNRWANLSLLGWVSESCTSIPIGTVVDFQAEVEVKTCLSSPVNIPVKLTGNPGHRRYTRDTPKKIVKFNEPSGKIIFRANFRKHCPNISIFVIIFEKFLFSRKALTISVERIHTCAKILSTTHFVEM